MRDYVHEYNFHKINEQLKALGVDPQDITVKTVGPDYLTVEAYGKTYVFNKAGSLVALDE